MIGGRSMYSRPSSLLEMMSEVGPEKLFNDESRYTLTNDTLVWSLLFHKGQTLFDALFGSIAESNQQNSYGSSHTGHACHICDRILYCTPFTVLLTNPLFVAINFYSL